MLRAMFFSLALVVLVLLGGAAIAGAASYGGYAGAIDSSGVSLSGAGANGPGDVPQPVPSCPAGVNYSITNAPTGTPAIEASTAGDTGNRCDDCVTSIELPFVQHFFGETFTDANLSSNGVLYFSNSPAAGGSAHDNVATTLPSHSFNYAILPYWQDLTTNASGDGVYTAVSGASPHRTLSIEWRAHTRGDAPVSFEVRLYEGRDRFSIVYRQVAEGGRGVTIGAQGGNFTIAGKPYIQQVTYSHGGPNLRAGLQLDFDRTYATCVCDPTSCETPTATPTEVCGVSISGYSFGCVPPGMVNYSFNFSSDCQSRVLSGNYTTELQVASNSGGPWTVYATQSGSRSFPPGTSSVGGTFNVQSVPPQYQYYFVAISVSLDNGQHVEGATAVASICHAATSTSTSTITNTPSSTSTPTVTSTATITPTPCSAAVEQITNGGFETGNLNGWAIAVRNAGTQLPRVLSGGHQGAYHADLTANDVNYPTRMIGIGQTIYVPPQGGTLGFWVAGTCYSSCYAQLEVNGASVAQLSIGSNWQYQAFDLTGYAGQFVSVAFWAGAASVAIDDVSFVAPGPCYTPTATETSTATATPPPSLVGHVVWQGAPAQPDPRQQQPITLTLKAGGTEVNYFSQTTDASGFFTVPLGTLPGGTYQWRAKGPKFLANSGSVGLASPNVPTTALEVGLMRTGDANNDNTVSASDFNILKATFGKVLGDPGYDPRADFDNDNTVSASDFNLLKSNFGSGGAPAVRPDRP